MNGEHSAGLPTWTSKVAPESAAALSEGSSGWRLSGSIDLREINYLSIVLAARVTDSCESSAAVLTFRFASRDVRDLASEATLFLEADAVPHSYFGADRLLASLDLAFRDWDVGVDGQSGKRLESLESQACESTTSMTLM